MGIKHLPQTGFIPIFTLMKEPPDFIPNIFLDIQKTEA